MIGSFGGAVFTVSSFKQYTFNGLTRDVEPRYATHELLTVKPRLEFIGPGLDAVSFAMQLHVSMGIRVRDELERWARMAENGEAHMLVLGYRPVGRNPFVISTLSEAYGIITNKGGVVSASLDVSLAEYVSLIMTSH